MASCGSGHFEDANGVAAGAETMETSKRSSHEPREPWDAMSNGNQMCCWDGSNTPGSLQWGMLAASSSYKFAVNTWVPG